MVDIRAKSSWVKWILYGVGMYAIIVLIFHLDKSSFDHLRKHPAEIIYFQSFANVVDFYGKIIVVDVGCGDGKLVTFFKARGVESIFGIDLEKVINETKKNSVEEYSSLFRTGIGEDIPFLDDTVDILLFQRTFHHVVEHEKALTEISRVLKPGGFVVFVEPVTVRGKYEIFELSKYIINEEDEKNYAEKLIKNGSEENGLFPVDFEKFVIGRLSVKSFLDIIASQEPELLENDEDYKLILKYAENIAAEDNVEVDDLRFYSTSRLNLWTKKN